MRTKSSNPRVTDLLLLVTAIEVLVLLASGGGLFFLPDDLPEIWPWELPPFNAAFLGAVYLASMLSAAVLVYIGRWSPARVVLPMILVFTAILLILTLLYLDRFDLSNPFTWLWLTLYTVIPINAAYHLWLYREQPPASQELLRPGWRAFFFALGILFGVYGLGLLIAPKPFIAFWPWQVDVFHARMYSVAFITPALGCLVLYRSAAWAEAVALGLTLLLGGLLPILGLVKVDLQVHRVDWGAPGTWLWIASFALFVVAGLGLLSEARLLQRPLGRLNEAGFVISPQLIALILGVPFIAAGIAGFLPSFTHTPPADAPPLLVHTSYGYLLGLFPINIIHNLFHLLIGILGVALSTKEASARLYLQGFSIVLAILTVAGLLPGFRSMFGLAPVYGHDVWLHATEALAAGYVGFVMPTRQAPSAAEAPLTQI